MQTERTDTSLPAFDALILAGGRASRLDGRSKPDVLVGGRRLLDHALDAVAGAGRTVVVGPPGLAVAPVLTALEDPPLGGPVAGVEAGLLALDHAATAAGEVGAPLVLLLACDVPLARHFVAGLLEAAAAALDRGLDGAQVVDPTGRPQPLLGAYRRGLLTDAIARLGAEGGTRDVAVRRLLAGASLRTVRDDLGHAADADTWQDVARLGVLLGSDEVGQTGSVPPK